MASASAPVLTETTAFLHRVLLDGRYIDRFQECPGEVARALGLQISAETAAEVSATDRDVLLRRLYAERFSPGSSTVHPYIVQEAAAADIGTTVVVGIAIGVVAVGIAAIIVLASSTRGIKDSSSERDSKL
jgi:hypothetical protein